MEKDAPRESAARSRQNEADEGCELIRIEVITNEGADDFVCLDGIALRDVFVEWFGDGNEIGENLHGLEINAMPNSVMMQTVTRLQISQAITPPISF